MTASGLRKDYTTLGAIAEMRKLCRVEVKQITRPDMQNDFREKMRRWQADEDDKLRAAKMTKREPLARITAAGEAEWRRISAGTREVVAK